MRLIFYILFLVIFSQKIYATEVTNWLKKEIDIILEEYKNPNASEEAKFLMIEDTINYNFAGAGIAKFVAGQAWATSDKSTKEEYIKLFKRHLALNIASMIR